MTLPEVMCAIEIRQLGGPEMLAPCWRLVPAIREDEILIRVAAAWLSRSDIAQRH